MSEIIKMSVFIHSHSETGKPHSVDVFEMEGKVNMQWFHEVFDENNDSELAYQFFSHLKKVDDVALFNVRAMQEDASGTVEHYVDVIGLAESEMQPDHNE